MILLDVVELRRRYIGSVQKQPSPWCDDTWAIWNILLVYNFDRKYGSDNQETEQRAEHLPQDTVRRQRLRLGVRRIRSTT
mmetsp:Transcript_10684/g.24355  ORF Transcript_10684/g.24355 Transcript_10684/m.24355 type:complete len:80 (+) Transcript_10684:296-535(+)